MKTIMNFFKDENGATAIEYALIAALISVAAIVAWTAVGSEVSGTMDKVQTAMSSAG